MSLRGSCINSFKPVYYIGKDYLNCIPAKNLTGYYASRKRMVSNYPPANHNFVRLLFVLLKIIP